MYTCPQVTRYTSDGLKDLLGPVETQYCGLDSITVLPDTFPFGKGDITVTLNGVVVTCPEFSDIQMVLIDSQNNVLDTSTFVPSDGQIQGANWTLTSYDFGFIPDRGTYRIEVTVTDSNNCSSESVSTGFTIL